MASSITTKIKGKQQENFFSSCYLSTENTEGRLMAFNDQYLAMAWKDPGKIKLVNSNVPCDLDMNSSFSNFRNQPILDMEFSPFDNKVLAFCNENKVFISEVKTNGIDTPYSFESKKINSINFNPVASNVICYSTSFGEIEIWDTVKSTHCFKINLEKKPNSIHWSPNGSLIGCIESNLLQVYDPRNNIHIFQQKLSANYKPKFAWLDNENLVSVNSDENNNKILSLFDIRQMKKNPYSSIEIYPNISQKIVNLFVNPELKIIYTTIKDEKEMNIFDYGNGTLQKMTDFICSEVNNFSIQLNRKYLDKNKLEIDRFARYTNNNKIYYISFFINNEPFYPNSKLSQPQMTYDEWFKSKDIIEKKENEDFENKKNKELEEEEKLKEYIVITKDENNRVSQFEGENNKNDIEKNNATTALTEQITLFKQKIEKLQEELDNKNKKLEKKEQKLKQFNEQISEIKKLTKSNITEVKDEYDRISKKLEEEKKIKENVISQYTNLINEMKNKIQLAKNNQRPDQEKEKPLSGQLEKYKKKAQYLENAIEEKNHEINKLNESLNQVNLELERIKKENSELAQEKNSLMKKIRDLELAKTENKKKANHSETNENKKTISDFQEEIRKLKEDIESNKKIIKEKDNIIAKEKSEKTKLINELNEKLKKSEEINKKNEEEISNLKKQNPENDQILKSQIEQIKEFYKKFCDDEIKKVKKNLIKTAGEGLNQFKNRYNKLYIEKENLCNSKINELNNLSLNSKMKLNSEQSINITEVNNKTLVNIDNNIAAQNNINNEESKNETQINLIDNENNIIINDNANNAKHNDINENNMKKDKDNHPKNNSNNNIIIDENHNYKNDKLFANKDDEDLENGEKNIITKITTDKTNIEDNKINEIIVNDNNTNQQEYSFDCTNSIYLSVYTYQGTDEAKFDICLKNNGASTWGPNTKLIIDKSSNCTTDEVILSQQKPNEEKIYKITINNLKDYPVGEYKVVYLFWSGGKIHGDRITAMVKIIEKDNKNTEIEENMDKIQEFRDTFNLSEEEHSNEKILDLLKENDFNFEKAFGEIYN